MALKNPDPSKVAKKIEDPKRTPAIYGEGHQPLHWKVRFADS